MTLTRLEKATGALKGTALGQGAFSKLARYKPSKQKAAVFKLLPRERLKPSLGDAPVMERMTEVIHSLSKLSYRFKCNLPSKATSHLFDYSFVKRKKIEKLVLNLSKS